MTSLVDFHCHLDLYPDFENIIDECENENIYTLTVTTTPQAWPKNLSLTKDKKYVRAALGMHPQLVGQRANELDLWDSYFPQAKYIGEIGLDAGPAHYKTLQQQLNIFDHIINRCASIGGKVLTIHSVRSADKVLSILNKYHVAKNNKVIFHWFSGTLSHAKEAAKIGCYFSINSQMLTNPKNDALLKTIPNNRILTETDGPFTFINNIPQRPKDVSYCVKSMASILNRPVEELRDQIWLNLKELLQP